MRRKPSATGSLPSRTTGAGRGFSVGSGGSRFLRRSALITLAIGIPEEAPRLLEEDPGPHERVEVSHVGHRAIDGAGQELREPPLRGPAMRALAVDRERG